MNLIRQNDHNLTKKNMQLMQVREVATSRILPLMAKVQSGGGGVREEAGMIINIINEMFETGAVQGEYEVNKNPNESIGQEVALLRNLNLFEQQKSKILQREVVDLMF